MRTKPRFRTEEQAFEHFKKEIFSEANSDKGPAKELKPN